MIFQWLVSDGFAVLMHANVRGFHDDDPRLDDPTAQTNNLKKTAGHYDNARDILVCCDTTLLLYKKKKSPIYLLLKKKNKLIR